MPRFYLPPSAIRGKSFVLSGAEAHHALNVLRKKVGDEIELFDGQDAAYRARIDRVSGEEIHGTLVENRPSTTLPVQLILYQALTKGSKWEWLLEKACEVGVAKVVPVITRRTLINLNAIQAREKEKRWNRVALAASKQCGRSDLMTVDLPLSLASAFGSLEKQALTVIPWEKEISKSIREAFAALHPPPSTVNIFIGPEGGWDPTEIQHALQVGAVPVRLGPTLLRTETAGLIAATLVFREFGVY